jgi:hypothetical protein
MSNITLNPNASGTGTFSIASPNSNADRTLTLPDSDGELASFDSSGNLGIGTSSPSTQLEVVNNNSNLARVRVSTTSTTAGNYRGYEFAQGSTFKGGLLQDQSNDAISVFTPIGGQSVTIDNSGRFMVGSTTTLGGNINTVTSASTWGISIKDVVNNQALMRFQNASASQVGSIQHNGTSTSYVTTSDYRLKTDAQPMTGASARVQALNPVNFEWIADGTRVDGFLAHEAQAVVPEAVTGTKDAVDADGNPDYQGIDQSKLVPLLTAALQEALTEITDLKARVAALEAV